MLSEKSYRVTRSNIISFIYFKHTKQFYALFIYTLTCAKIKVRMKMDKNAIPQLWSSSENSSASGEEGLGRVPQRRTSALICNIYFITDMWDYMTKVNLLNFDVQIFFILFAICLKYFISNCLWKTRENIFFQSQEEKSISIGSKVAVRLGLMRGYFSLR